MGFALHRHLSTQRNERGDEPERHEEGHERELVARHGRDADSGDDRTSVINYLAWPVHIRDTATGLERYASDLAGSAGLIFFSLDGRRWTMAERHIAPQAQPTEAEWAQGLTAMRKAMRDETHARIVLGGRVEGYKGAMPGIAEEALLSLHAGQPLFLIGGFGGCARDVAETLGLVSPSLAYRPAWKGREAFEGFKGADLSNGLTSEENTTLIHTPHVDQAVTLILRGLLRLSGVDPSSQ